ncbi:MAG: polyamine ABC transporter ATP-binding protein [Erysipelotrichaceae bacterium]|nr:polyamine ABC transporter ATP-binding protein [Erysipelotrichaceae bacterium]
MKKLIEFRNIVKSFDGNVVLKGINLDIYENEFVTLLGPSGCGKTTLLRILGGFLDADEGEVIFDGEDISKVPAYKREVNTVFQRYALFPHLNVYDNIAFGLKIKKQSKDVIDQKVNRMLSLIGLEGYGDRDVNLLSGGQQQRVAIARALVNEPYVLLLDEPLSALDKALRKEMQYELKRIQQEVGITFIFVTHDQEEALTMSDKIVVMKDGNIIQIGTPTEIYNEPINEYVAHFIGESNIFDGVMKDDYLVSFDDKDYKCVDFGFRRNEPVDVMIRPEDLEIVERGKGLIPGEVKFVLFKGLHNEVTVQTVSGASKTVTMHVTANHDLTNAEAGEKISANDFYMDLEDVEKLTDYEVIARANAQAWDEEDELLSIRNVEYDIKAEPGTYEVTFSTAKDTSITIKAYVMEPKYTEDDKQGVGVAAFDFFITADELKESIALDTDLCIWAKAEAWDLETGKPIEIYDVIYDFDEENISEGDYKITYAVQGHEFKVHTTKNVEEGRKVDLMFTPEDIHVMSKMGY